MIAEALQYLARIQTPKNPQTVVIHEQPYRVNVDGTLGDVVQKPDMDFAKPPLEVATLGALVAAYKAAVNGMESAKTMIHIESPFRVVVSDVVPDEFGNRSVHVVARHAAEIPFMFDRFYEIESFLIAFRASFYYNDEAVKVQTLCSTVESGASVSVADDGVSQKVTASAGTVTKSQITLPADGISLVPWRTFRDVNPVESKFLLRMKAAKDALPTVALFSIDEKWKLDTVQAIAKYLGDALPDARILA